MRKFYTDQERYEYCRRYKISGLTKQEFAEKNGINRHTLSDWIKAYNNIHGKFINVSKYLNYVFKNIDTLPIDELLPYSKDLTKKL